MTNKKKLERKIKKDTKQKNKKRPSKNVNAVRKIKKKRKKKKTKFLIRRILVIFIFLFIIYSIFCGVKFLIELIPTKKIIVIDAGHGGNDPGFPSKYSKSIFEKEINLKIAKKLESKLEKKYKVHMIRTQDIKIDNYNRAKKANELEADIFISIHANSFEDQNVEGIEIFYDLEDEKELEYGNQKQKDSKFLADFVLNDMVEESGANKRGVKKNHRIIVTRETNMPAILIETGFMSNSKEFTKLNTDLYQQKLVDGVEKGLENYFISIKDRESKTK
ncbi:N-acetylmuramoyl-L-alanine amidase [Peptostreptococcaceae bacterium AGR-M142]